MNTNLKLPARKGWFDPCGEWIGNGYDAEWNAALDEVARLNSEQPSPAFAKPSLLKDCDVRYAANAQPSNVCVSKSAEFETQHGLSTERDTQPSIFPAYDPNRCLACGENHGSSNLPCPKMRTTSAVNPKAQLSPAPELERPESSDDWASALLDVAVLREALTSSDSSERLKNMDAGEVMRRAFGKLKEIRAQHQRIDAARVAEIERLKAEITDQALIAASEARRALAAENQRDAALSRLAEIERQDPVAHANPSDLENDGFTHTFHARSESWEGSVPLYAHPVAQAGQVPKEAGESDAPRMSADTEPEIAWRDGFNACRDRWLAAAPQPETVKNHEHPTDD